MILDLLLWCLAVLIGFGAWVGLSSWWAVRLRFYHRDPDILRVAVGEQGHHIALLRYSPETQKYREPV